VSKPLQRRIKRGFDVVAAICGLVLGAPFMAAATVAVAVTMGRPVLFRQARVGLHGQSFTIVKFRTMRGAEGPDGQPLADAERLTRLGVFLRDLSLDELPQLWNVLRGDLSVVGPRPLLLEYLPLYTPEQARRHEVPPGITGWAQVNGRNGVSWDQRFVLDVWYVDHWSLLLDARILIMTIGKVLRRAGISGPGVATMTRFVGSDAKRDELP